MLFIFLLGAVEIVPLFLGHITGKQYPITSHLQPPIGSAGDAEGSPSGHGADPDSVEGSTARTSEIERLKKVRRKAKAIFFFPVVHIHLTEISVREGGVPRRDTRRDVAATDFFPLGFHRNPGSRLGRHSLLHLWNVVARSGCFWKPLLGKYVQIRLRDRFSPWNQWIEFQIHQQPALGILPAGLFERLYLRLGDFRRLGRLFDAAAILTMALMPLFLLPLLLPLPAASESSWVRSMFQVASDVFLSAVGVVQSYITFTTLLVVGLAYWVGSVYLEYEEDGGVAA